VYAGGKPAYRYDAHTGKDLFNLKHLKIGLCLVILCKTENKMSRGIKNICFFLFLAALPCLADSYIESRLSKDMEDHRLDNYSKIQAAFILSGATHPDSLSYYLKWYNTLVKTLKDYNFDPFDRINSAGNVFGYLHSNWLITYQEKATTLINVVKQKQFNCVAGTILYNLICEDMGWATEAFETPTHTYTIFTDFSRRLMVENTSGMGFNIMENLKEYSQYLLQFYPEDRRYQIGLDKIYAYENTQGRQINNTELLGLLAYNRAYFAMQVKDYRSAFNFVTLAQQFNRDSRSNYNFEIDLYHKWGKKLFDEQNYEQSFEVFQIALSRHPEVKEFVQNSRACFFNALATNWTQKNWQSTTQLVPAMLALQIMNDSDLTNLQRMLANWGDYFYRTQMKFECRQTTALWAAVDPNNPQLQRFQAAIETLP